MKVTVLATVTINIPDFEIEIEVDDKDAPKYEDIRSYIERHYPDWTSAVIVVVPSTGEDATLCSLASETAS